MFIIKLSNGRGFFEWYESLSIRAQADRRADAMEFSTREQAEAKARFCESNASAFSEIYFDDGRGCYTLIAEVEPK